MTAKQGAISKVEMLLEQDANLLIDREHFSMAANAPVEIKDERHSNYQGTEVKK
ncbi:MAG: hypothetical protein KME05_22580 [Gloeocapsa sp. UFS-A4-WI-NPMV-4B04]|nr:hypothetical protein [Gloeocapsa sp. UFS-A4-WI-NPMV-4B04]